MRQRFNTVIIDRRTHAREARLFWAEPGEVVLIQEWEEPFSITSGGESVDVEIVVEHDVREFAFRERQN